MKRILDGAGRGTAALVVSVVALVVAAAGGAYAAGQASTTITLCVSRHGGAVYKAKRCKRRDSKLSFNTTGPAGATGATGAAGPDTGVAGGSLAGSYPDPSLASSAVGAAQLAAGAVPAYQANGTTTTFTNKADVVVATLSLPAGSYQLAANVGLSATVSSGTGQAAANCALLAAGSSTTALWNTTDSSTQATVLPFDLVTTLSAPGTVTIECSDVGGGGTGYAIEAYGATIDATRVTQANG
jgi:hypothetical protein